MDLCSDFISRWPVPSALEPKIVSPKTRQVLYFVPSPQSLTDLLTSISPNIVPRLPMISSTDDEHLLYNTFCILRIPNSLSLLAFFPAGDDSDQVGFVTLSVHSSKLRVDTLKDQAGPKVWVSDAEHKVRGERIFKLMVNPLLSGTSTIGFLMASTVRGVHWYRVEIDNKETPKLEFIGSKLFKSLCVVDACWSPHIPEESLVLLEKGKLFLFDMDAFSSGDRLEVSWKGWPNLGESGWLGCEFSWHPEILVVAHSSAVFILDLRVSECVVTCLLEIGTSAIYTPTADDCFFAFSKAGSDHHHFIVASENRVVLSDVRKPLMPLLQWTHDILNPSYINVFPLSQLKVYPKENDGSKGLGELGNCIIMGSFWNCEFNVFCYGPAQATKSDVPTISKIDNKVCALDSPSELSISGRDCSCGSCLLREESWKDSLDPWIDWRQKKEIVLGFAIIDKDIDAKLSEQGGFTLVRLMSSGKIESQRYTLLNDFVDIDEAPVEKSVCDYEDTLLFIDNEREYDFPKRFQYHKLHYLCAYLKDDLGKVLFDEVKKPRKDQCTSDYNSSIDFHQSVCEKLKNCGFNKSSNAVSDVVKHTRSMSSVHEVALSKMWTHFPLDLLRLSFSDNSELLKVLLENKKISLEILDDLDQLKNPLVLCGESSKQGSKRTRKGPPGTGFVGSSLPTPVMLTISELRKENVSDFSANSEIRDQCNEVIEVAKRITGSASGSDFRKKPASSLGIDKDETSEGIKNVNRISLHRVIPQTYGSSTEDAMSEDPVSYDEKFTTFICKKKEKKVSKTDGPELFDSLCPIELKFDGPMKQGTNSTTLKYLKKRYSKFLQNYDPYQQYLEKNNLPKRG